MATASSWQRLFFLAFGETYDPGFHQLGYPNRSEGSRNSYDPPKGREYQVPIVQDQANKVDERKVWRRKSKIKLMSFLSEAGLWRVGLLVKQLDGYYAGFGAISW